jgi:hypothetical protein
MASYVERPRELPKAKLIELHGLLGDYLVHLASQHVPYNDQTSEAEAVKEVTEHLERIVNKMP